MSNAEDVGTEAIDDEDDHRFHLCRASGGESERKGGAQYEKTHEATVNIQCKRVMTSLSGYNAEVI